MAGALGCACGAQDDTDLLTLRVERVSVDTDVSLEPVPGQGAGAHFDVDADGNWRVQLTCDTELTGYVCDFDVLVSVEPPASLSSTRAYDLERDDAYWYVDSGALRLLTYTAFDVDELTFHADPDEPLRIDVLLDGAYVPGTIAYSSQGKVRTLAPSMPMELVPTR
jgi:hypothetical protein